MRILGKTGSGAAGAAVALALLLSADAFAQAVETAQARAKVRYNLVLEAPIGPPRKKVRVNATGGRWTCVTINCQITLSRPSIAVHLKHCRRLAASFGRLRAFTATYISATGRARRIGTLSRADIRKCNTSARTPKPVASGGGGTQPTQAGDAGTTSGDSGKSGRPKRGDGQESAEGSQPSGGGQFKQGGPQFDYAIAEFTMREVGSRRVAREVHAGQHVFVFMRVQGNGMSPHANAIEYQLFLDGQPYQSGWLDLVRQGQFVVIAQGDLFRNHLFNAPGQHEWRVVLDPNNRIQELNEGNNERRIPFTVTAHGEGGVDLGIGSAYVYDPRANNQVPLRQVPAGKPVALKVNVINTGGQLVPGATIVARHNGREIDRRQIGAIGPGQQRWINLVTQNRAPPGQPPQFGYAFSGLGPQSLTVHLDPENRLRETNEGNNRETVNIEVMRGSRAADLGRGSPDIGFVKAVLVSHDPRLCDNQVIVGGANTLIVTYRYVRPVGAARVNGVTVNYQITGRGWASRAAPGHPSGLRQGGSRTHTAVIRNAAGNARRGLQSLTIRLRPSGPDGVQNNNRGVLGIAAWRPSEVDAPGFRRATPNCRTPIP